MKYLLFVILISGCSLLPLPKDENRISYEHLNPTPSKPAPKPKPVLTKDERQAECKIDRTLWCIIQGW